MIFLLAYIILAVVIFKLVSGWLTKFGVFAYFTILYIFITGISGLRGVDKVPSSDLYWLSFNINLLILMLHLPVVYILLKTRTHRPNVKKARELFDKDIAHLHDHEVHQHLQYKH